MSRTPVPWVLGSLLAGGACSHERDERLNGPVPVILGASQAGSSGSGGKAPGTAGKPGAGGRSASGSAAGASTGGTRFTTGGRDGTAAAGSGPPSPGGCQPGTARCDAVDPLLRTCDDSGKWQVETCPFVCRAGACGGECQPGERRCDGLQPMRCSDLGAFITDGQACSVACERGACAGMCSDGDKQCASATAEQLCEENVWGAPEPCQFACVDGACGGECTPGSRRCSSETEIETCSTSGVWSAASACDFTCVDGACTGECRPGDTRCAGADVEECAPTGTWNRVTTCPNACIDGGCGGECPAGATLCASPTTVKTCGADNEWGPPAPCPNACVGTGCTGECAPGTRQCTGNGKPSQRTCNDQGVFVTSQCEAGESCQDGECDGFPKVIFVTSELYDGNLGGVSGADQKCQELADRVGISGRFLALVSEPGRTIFDRFDGEGGPYQLTDGAIVANHFEELGNTLGALNLTEVGTTPSEPDLGALSEAGLAELTDECRERRLQSLVWCNAPVTGTGKSVCSNFSRSTGASGASFCDWSTPDWDRACGVALPASDEGYCQIRAPLVCIQR